MRKQLHLGLFGGTGPESWLADSGQLYDWRKPELIQEVAKLAERAKFDLLLFADTLSIPSVYQDSFRYPARTGSFVSVDPILSLGMLSAVTTHIGLGATVSSTFVPPYMLARQLSALDHLSGGRAAWNVVTSAQVSEANNFGVKLPEHDLRYDMADEHLALCRALWSSWDVDAVTMDRESRTFADHNKIHHIDFEGKYYASRGPLNTPRSPQGQPVIIMAGSSPRGQRFAAENAEVTLANKNTVEDMKSYSTAIRRGLVSAGRDPNSCKVLFTIRPWIGASEQEAREKMERNKAQANLEDGLGWLSAALGYDMAKFDLDMPLPPDLPINAIIGKMLQHSGVAGKALTVREIGRLEASRETFPVCGTPDQVADILISAAAEADADGFMFRFATQDYLYVAEIVSKLVPALRRRGAFREEYTGTMLREHLFGARE